jgi:PPIC-type PPIASE domain
MASGVTGFLKRVVREPLVHFLAIGAALFVVNGLINGPDTGPAGQAIVIPAGRVNQIAESFVLISGRAPTKEELQVLVDDYVSEEVGYREAVAMGLDADDTIVRRRMRQKLEFLIEDSADNEEPTQAEMQAWLDSHSADYRLPERRALRHVLLSSDKRGASAAKDAEAALASLRAGADPLKLGDASMLPPAIPFTSEEGVAGEFGPAFASAAFSHAGTDWFGPVASPFGQHLISVIGIEPGRAVALPEVIDKVRSDIVEARRNDARDAFHARMRKRYVIHIDWPAPWSGLPDTPDPNPKTKSIPEVGE